MRHLILALSTAAIAASPVAFAADWAKNFSVGGAPVVDIRSSDANVDVRPGSSGTISARVTTKGWEIKPGEIEVIERQQGDRVDIEVRHPRMNWNVSGIHGERWVRVEVTVPAQTRLHVNTGDGNVTLNGIKSEIRIETGDGNITGDTLDGRLEARTGDGNIRVSGRFDTVNVDTGDGNVELAASSGSTAGGPWRLHTGDGNVKLRVPQELQVDLDATSGDGHVSTDLPITLAAGKIGSHQLRGKLNGGGPTVTIRTGDGNISLARN